MKLRELLFLTKGDFRGVTQDILITCCLFKTTALCISKYIIFSPSFFRKQVNWQLIHLCQSRNKHLLPNTYTLLSFWVLKNQKVLKIKKIK